MSRNDDAARLQNCEPGGRQRRGVRLVEKELPAVGEGGISAASVMAPDLPVIDPVVAELPVIKFIHENIISADARRPEIGAREGRAGGDHYVVIYAVHGIIVHRGIPDKYILGIHLGVPRKRIVRGRDAGGVVDPVDIKVS